MRPLLLSTLLFLSSFFAYAQPDESKTAIDSMLKLLTNAKDDEQRVRTYQQLSFLYSMTDPDKGIECAQKELEIASKMKWKEQIAISYGNIGQNYSSKGDNAKAIEYLLKTLAIFQELNNEQSSAITMIALANAYSDMHNYPKAIYYDTASLNILLRHKQYGEATGPYNSLGSVYSAMKKYDESLKYYFLAYHIADSLHNDEAMSAPLGNIGSVYSEKGDYNNALFYLFRALRLNRKIGNKLFESININTIGEAYYRVITDSVHKAVPDSLISADRSVNLRKAEGYIALSVQMQKDLGAGQELATSYVYLSELQELKGNYKSALENYKLYKQYSDSTESNDVRLKIAASENKYQAELTADQVKLNKLTIAQKRNERIIFAAGIGVLLLVTGGIYSRFRHQKKTSEIQQAALRQKEMLMKEIHHRVKNNLQVISSLLNMQVVNINDPQVKEAMTESTSRLKSILLLHQQLYRDDQVANIECSNFINDLFNQVSTVFKKPGQNIKLNNNIGLITMDIDTGMSLGLIINELTTNSYKYAFGDGDGYVTLDIKRNGTDEYKLYYKDSGPGLPEGVDTKTVKSLGMKIMNSLSRQIGGAMQYDRETNNFIITFKDVDGRKKKA